MRAPHGSPHRVHARPPRTRAADSPIPSTRRANGLPPRGRAPSQLSSSRARHRGARLEGGMSTPRARRRRFLPPARVGGRCPGPAHPRRPLGGSTGPGRGAHAILAAAGRAAPSSLLLLREFQCSRWISCRNDYDVYNIFVVWRRHFATRKALFDEADDPPAVLQRDAVELASLIPE